MSSLFSAIEPEHRDFIEAQPLFFVATAARDGRINLSPKGLDTFRVLDATKVAWLNLTGSGNETAAHLRELGRMTLMFCAFTGDPLILRLYGQARAVHADDPEWHELLGLFPPHPGCRQVMLVDVELVTTACGYAVPLMDYVGQRTALVDWAREKGDAGIREYWADRNVASLDGVPTGVPLSPTEDPDT